MRFISTLTLFLLWFIFLEGHPAIQEINYPSKKDTVLYLYFDKGVKPEIRKYKHTTTRFYQNGVYQKRESDCGYHTILEKNVCPPSSYSIDNIPFIGLTTDGYTAKAPDTVTNRELKKYRVVQIQELNHFLKTEYTERDSKEYAPKDYSIEPIGPDPMGSESYWRNLKAIYVVEKMNKNRSLITEVKRNITIE